MPSADRAHIYVDDSGSMWGFGDEVEALIDEYNDPNVYRVGDYVACWAGPHIGAGHPNLYAMCAHAETVGAKHLVFVTDEHAQLNSGELDLLREAGFFTRIVRHPPLKPSVKVRAGHSTPEGLWSEKDAVLQWEESNRQGWATLSKDQRKLIMGEVRQGLRNIADNLTDDEFENLVSGGLEHIEGRDGDYFTFRMFIKGGHRG